MKMSKAIEAPEYAQTSNFYFDKKNPAPKNFDDLQIDEEVTVKIKGKIVAIRQDPNEPLGKSFEITADKVKIAVSDSKPMGVGEGMAKIQKERSS